MGTRTCSINAKAKVPAASPAPATCLLAAHVTVDFIRCLIAHTTTDSASYRVTLNVAVAIGEEIELCQDTVQMTVMFSGQLAGYWQVPDQ